MPEPRTGMLVIPLEPPNPECGKAMMDRLRGHATSDLWLPADTGWPELDEARDKHLRARAHIDHALGELAELRERYRVEDKAHDEAHLQAARDGQHSVDDHRTPSQGRQDQKAEIADRVWVGVLVLADVVDDVIELIRENRDRWLAYLNGKREPAAEKRRKAEQLLYDADVEEFGLAQRADWLKKTADDGAYGKQPFPEPGPRPKQMSQQLIDSMFVRHWSQKDGVPMRSWQQVSGVSDEAFQVDPTDVPEVPEPDDGQPKGDPTGVVSELDEAGARS